MDKTDFSQKSVLNLICLILGIPKPLNPHHDLTRTHEKEPQYLRFSGRAKS
jgi:hypothetical protein